jgi:CubicO group peptidase (beta-lactamase class C family)
MNKTKVDDHFKRMQGYSLTIFKHGKSVVELGKTNSLFNISSLRKTLLSALYGIFVEKKVIDLDATLAELGINDKPPGLTKEELQTTVRNLLKMRSGIYHPANYETISTKDSRPKRHSFNQGEHYYYNNWDANTLGSIFTKLTGEDIFKSFKQHVGDKLSFEDFDIDQCEYKAPDLNSSHRAYLFKMSTRDLVKFGNLFAESGVANGNQIISNDWIKESTAMYSKEQDGRGVGYFWYVANKGRLFGNYKYPNDAIGFSGYPGHFLLVIPSSKLTAVYAHDIFNYEKPKATSQEFGDLISSLEEYS